MNHGRRAAAPQGRGEGTANMPLKWLILILAAILAAMMTIVMLRAETARLHYELSQYDRQARVLRQELREQELELARLRNPALIRGKLAEMRLGIPPADGDGPARRRNKR